MSQPSQGHILVIDDEPIVRESLAVYLSDSGFQVDTAKNGDEGLALFRNKRPDLVICDLRMPLFDGLDVLKAMNAESPETPVIVVSGQGSMNDVVTALRNGAVDYLFKPLIEMEVLEHSVRRALERGHLLKQNRQIREQLELTNAELERSLDLLEEDQEAGRRVQRRMLPPTPHVFNDVAFSHRIIPSLYLSGDFVDYFRIGPERIGFYLADVSGHGASSAFVTVFLKTLTNRIQRHYEKRTATNALSPSRLLTAINQELISMGMGKHLAMFCGVIDLAENRLVYCIGAHFPPPILVNNGVAQALEGRGLPVGIFSDATFEDVTLPLAEKFSLVAMSDGVLEVLPEGSMEEKEAHLLDIVGQVPKDADALATALQVDGEVEVPDDIALLVINRNI
ncbi:MAG: Two-component system response regulator [Moraxellaceae bacterium]|jgi:serine phosphatase RsbU (regulator of sigma subunit)|nr:Two-component system response regulator [Moraxellaceae bacterium]MDF3031984.1 Two-component system response regulator [Moraxellaceae bacterium]